MASYGKKAGLGLLVAGMIACSPTYDVHGYVPSEEDLAQISYGQTDRMSAEAILGVPAAQGLLDGNEWIYLRKRVRNFTWNAPEEVDREVMVVTFNENNTVADITRYGLRDGRVIDLTRDVTVTSGRSLNVLTQLLGSIGNLNAGDFLGGDD
ncbi:outer membrane protein assembly factor BamE [Paracoccaceae bacterium GXU_MW_L88]